MTASTTGAITMALEIVAFRLYAPYFGYSIYVWGSLISVVMLALSVGYALGGWVADRSPGDGSLYGMILLSGIYQFLILLMVGSLLPWCAQFGEFSGPVGATLIIFALPMVALAATSPMVIRLLARAGHIGSSVGAVLALSTAGGIGGVLGTSFGLVPRLGTQATLKILCALSMVLGVVGLIKRRRTALVALLALPLLPALPEAPSSEGTVWTSESPYNLVRVVRRGRTLFLFLNDEASVHTIRDEVVGWTGYYYDDYALGPLLVSGRRALVLGMGAGGSISAMRAAAPDMEVDAVEIDPKVAEAGVRFFGLPSSPGWLHVNLADARPWISRCPSRYDLVQVDLYQGGPYIPFYLATIEFFGLVRAHLAEGGVLMMNVFDASIDQHLVLSTVATLKRVFASVLVLTRQDMNRIIFAFPQERSVISIQSAFRQDLGREPVRQLALEAATAIRDVIPPSGTMVFTDDRAPIEEMTRRMLADAHSAQRGSRTQP
ncbi:MAG TPA: fused MFS/spermidine synthase [Vicinamibacteria bacterium]|nr:fused MFS/spermidine synthase [Vicinamibacteria bacterium]